MVIKPHIISEVFFLEQANSQTNGKIDEAYFRIICNHSLLFSCK